MTKKTTKKTAAKKVKKDDVVVETEIGEVQPAQEQPPVEKNEEKQPEVKEKKSKSVEDVINEAADLAARLPAHAGKSAAQHGTDIARAIRDMLKNK